MTVQDPEIPVNIYDLGLIYDIISHTGGNISITMSLTAPGCPVAGGIANAGCTGCCRAGRGWAG